MSEPNRKCRGCGCTEDKACVTEAGPCHWVEADLCSACETRALAAFAQGFDKVCLNIVRMAKAQGAILIILRKGKQVEVAAAVHREEDHEWPEFLRKAAKQIEAQQCVEKPVQHFTA